MPDVTPSGPERSRMVEGWLAAGNGKAVAQDELDKIAAELLEASRGISVWLFFGEMGSGKTTLIKSIGKALGVQETMSSPTFSIVNEYRYGSGKRIFHVDLYRLNSEKEIFETGAEDYLYSNDLCMIEWPEKLGSLTPPDHFKVRISPVGNFLRKIEYQRA